MAFFSIGHRLPGGFYFRVGDSFGRRRRLSYGGFRNPSYGYGPPERRVAVDEEKNTGRIILTIVVLTGFGGSLLVALFGK
jgi:hypothetical protein